jgi:hypothetical protein
MPEKTKRKRKRKSVLASAPAYKPEPQRGFWDGVVAGVLGLGAAAIVLDIISTPRPRARALEPFDPARPFGFAPPPVRERLSQEKWDALDLLVLQHLEHQQK